MNTSSLVLTVNIWPTEGDGTWGSPKLSAPAQTTWPVDPPLPNDVDTARSILADNVNRQTKSLTLNLLNLTALKSALSEIFHDVFLKSNVRLNQISTILDSPTAFSAVSGNLETREMLALADTATLTRTAGLCKSDLALLQRHILACNPLAAIRFADVAERTGPQVGMTGSGLTSVVVGRPIVESNPPGTLNAVTVPIPEVVYPFHCPEEESPLLLAVSGRQHHDGWGSSTAFGHLGQ